MDHDLVKRRFDRCHVNERAWIFCRGRYEIETIVEISEGGTLIESDRAFVIGDDIEMSFVLDRSDKLITAKGEVIYVLPVKSTLRLVGIRFTTISLDSQDIIRTHVKREKLRSF